MEEQRIYLELQLNKSIATDSNGNYIVWAEASNENLDFQDQVVLQRALLESKDYFLKNGVISYDHMHLQEKENPERYIIGEPLDVVAKGKKTFVKMLLYKSNEIVKELINKIKDGSSRIKTSIGGKFPKVVKAVDETGKLIEKVVSVLWDELAITYKPVNQTLQPVALSSAAFVKALAAGYGGEKDGSALLLEDLEGTKKKVNGLILAILYGDVRTPEDIKTYLANYGLVDREIDQIINYLLENKEKIRGVVKMADEKLTKALDEAIDELQKAMKGKKKKEEYPDSDEEQVPIEAADQEAEGPESDDEEDDEGYEGFDEYDEDEKGTKVKKKVKKSLHDTLSEKYGEYLDVSDFLNDFTKSLSDRIESIEKSINGILKVQKAIGGSVLASAQMLKSIGEMPLPRQAVLSKSERKFAGDDGKEIVMSRSEILQKAMAAMEKGMLNFVDVSKIEDRLNKGMPIDTETLKMLKSL